jgi:putative DNA primase/helicase
LIQLPDIFRGFIPLGDGKAPVSKYTGKDAKVFPLREVERGNFAGLLQEGWCFIDVDDGDDAELLFKIITEYAEGCHIQQTTRGYHFYYRNPGIARGRQDNKTSIGLTVELKVNPNHPVPLKINNEARKWLQILDNDEVQEVPMWLRHNRDIDEFDLRNLKTGGRNNTLFDLKRNLLRRNFSVQDIRDTINIVNNHIAEKPLPRKEIDTILRDTDQIKKKTFFVDNKFNHAVFGDYLMNNFKFGIIEGRLHIQTEDYIYIADERAIERAMVNCFVGVTYTQRLETLRYLDIMCKRNLQLSEKEFIPLRDKVYNLNTGELLDYNTQFVFKNKMPYMPGEYHELADKTLNKLACNDPNLRMLLEELLGYGMFRRNELRASFILLGNKKSGKSTFLTVLKKLYGRENYSTLSIQDLEDRFRPAELDGKMINVGDDISDKYMEDNSAFKKLVTGDEITVERKGKDPFTYRSTVKFYFAANKLPRVNDKGSGFIDRVIVFPFNATFGKNNPDFDPFIIEKLTADDAMSYFMSLALQGLKRVIDNNGFTQSTVVESAREDYDLINNPHYEFIREHQIEHQTVKDVRTAYRLWCGDNGYTELGSQNFNKDIYALLGLKSKPVWKTNKTVKCYEKE